MFTTKSYTCICQVCQKVHTVDAEFLSVSRYGNDPLTGNAYPMVSCGSHTSAELKAEWQGAQDGERRAQAECDWYELQATKHLL